MFSEKFFKPIIVSIYPGNISKGYWRILADYKITDSEEAKMLGHKMLHEKAESLVVKQGIRFTILRADSEGSIFYDNNQHLFYSKLDIREKITEIIQKTEHGTFTPELYVKTGDEGFDIGLITAESMGKSMVGGDERELLKITTLPYAALGLYKWSNMNQGQIDKLISPLGWEREAASEVPTLLEQPVTLEHKYFSVTFGVS